MSLESAMALAALCFIAMVTPGPGILALVSHALTKGFARTAPMIVGMLMGDLAYVLLVIGGLAVIARSFETTFLVIRLLAAAYLVYIGIRAWMAAPVQSIPADKIERGTIRGILSGLLLTLSNPKVIVFYVGILPGFMDLGALDAKDAVLAVAIVLGVLLSVLLGYTLAATRARAMLSSERSQKIINRGAGSVFIGAGITIAAKG